MSSPRSEDRSITGAERSDPAQSAGDLVNVVIPPLAEPLTYFVPPGVAADVGHAVDVPLGRRTARGFVVAKRAAAEPAGPFALKPISDETLPCFLPSQIRFFEWIADYYGAPLSTVIEAAIPPHVAARVRSSVTIADESAARAARGTAAKEIVEFLLAAGGRAVALDELRRRWRGAPAAVRRLAERGAVTLTSEECFEDPFQGAAAPAWAPENVLLNPEQAAACGEIVAAARGRVFAPFVLHGVTGSGKTEVYLDAIRETLALGRGALLIVPEIALTPQLVDRFRARLGDDLSVLHSALSRRVRWSSWRSLLAGRTRVAVGARSAIFAPVPDLGLIIVDEEHDASYKQAEGLRYNARDLAVVRSQLDSVPVVLGSATPSLETFHNARAGRYRLLPLTGRHTESSSVSVKIVDMGRVKPWELAAPHLSPDLAAELAKTVERGEQAFLLYNRRGFASFLECDRCSAAVQCPNCSVTLTLHRARNALLCHYCSYTLVPSEICAVCEDRRDPGKLVERGAGTEKIFDEVRTLFPDARVERLDRDAASDFESYRSILDRVRSGEVQILVGTQMIAKGHDLPGVTLVGVADCDVGLHLPDFRAAERVFQLLTQAAGRSGRGGSPGRVVLQTRKPSHPSLVLTAAQDYTAFADLELEVRRAFSYPPFSRLLRIVASATVPEQTTAVLRLLRARLEQLRERPGSTFTVLGPAPAPLQKLKTLWRSHLLVKAPGAAAVSALIPQLKAVKLPHKNVRVIYDLDPQDML